MRMKCGHEENGIVTLRVLGRVKVKEIHLLDCFKCNPDKIIELANKQAKSCGGGVN